MAEAYKDCAGSLFCLRRTPPHGVRAWAVIAKRAVAARALHCVLRASPLVYDMRMARRYRRETQRVKVPWLQLSIPVTPNEPRNTHLHLPTVSAHREG